MAERFDALVVGTGHGGAKAAMALRQHGFTGTVAMVGREDVPPYERPPLSKEYLARAKPFERILIRPESYWAASKVTWIGGQEVVALDAQTRTVATAAGRSIGYRELIWATGGAPRRLSCPGAELAGVHSLRDKADVDRMVGELDGGATRVVVIGGGYIGLEAAAVLIGLGCSVTLLEAQNRVLARVAGEALSRFFEAEHRARGLDLRLGSSVERLEGADGRVTGVRLADGEALPCDFVLVGIGIEPAVAPLLAAGAQGGNGVEVDAATRTSLPHIHAVGDCAAHPNAHADGALIRLESVQNANDMADTAARDLCGLPAAYSATPWFWSNQYDLKLQTVGLGAGHDDAVMRGRVEDRSFSVVYLRDGRVVALDCVNMVRDYVQGRKLVEAAARPTAAQLADTAVPLKALLG